MAPLTVAVTGISGFVGRHVAAELRAYGHSIIGIGRRADPPPDVADAVDEYVRADLVSGWPTLPDVDAVIHLAGLAAVGESFGRPQDYITVNSAMVTNLGEHYLHAAHHPRLVGVSSGTIYRSTDDSALTESAPLAINSPYVVSKLLVENQFAYYTARGVNSVVARPFNHVGPGQGSGFLMADLIREVRQAQLAGTNITVGNLTTTRDYTDVRDVAAAYRLLATAEHLSASVYNVCSGRPVTGTELLTMIRMAMGADSVTVEIDPAKFRPTDAPYLVGNAQRLKNDVGWTPTIPLEQTIADLAAEQAVPAGARRPGA